MGTRLRIFLSCEEDRTLFEQIAGQNLEVGGDFKAGDITQESHNKQ